ncbi:DUF4265 domain-containing protein [Pseudomonas sp. NPDC089401]|uniref:DUF4265 domain-containing protein n=1 Tax=Pseudomonas sp. NPDC089401 TaxID=3364462 RepID=UPI00380BEA34
MEGKEGFCLIKVFVSANGPVHEQLPALEKAPNVYELLSSPGLALNLAKGDLISIEDNNAPALVIERGGNFCINLYAEHLAHEQIMVLESQVNQQLSGTLDGLRNGNMAFSVPASNGMEKIQSVFNAFKQATGVEWYYSNIYKNLEDLEDETLLDWWLDN